MRGKAGGGKRSAASGTRKAERGKRNAEGGARQAERGKRQAEGGKRKAASGTRKSVLGSRSSDIAPRTSVVGSRSSDLALRPLRPSDRQPIATLVRATASFSEDEIAVAVELVDEALSHGDESGYHFIVAARDGHVVGYTCYGPTPLTHGVYDLYWIAVDPRTQRGGVGKQLMRAAEIDVARRGGRLLIIETGGRDTYAPTRVFYERCGYTLAARLPDYYSLGDDKVFFIKRV
jgi:ribosomal protein S18 acetylase RimI-like enzyme